jgi:Peptidase family M41
MVLLGGRAAERVVYGQVSSGAAGDLQQANAVARCAVTELGFSPRAGQLVDRLAGRGIRLAETTHEVIDEEVERMIADAYRDAIAMVERHRARLDRLAGRLIEAEELDRLEIAAALGDARPRVPARRHPGPRAEASLRGGRPTARQAARARRPLRRRIAPALSALLAMSARRIGRDGRAPTA